MSAISLTKNLSLLSLHWSSRLGYSHSFPCMGARGPFGGSISYPATALTGRRDSPKLEVIRGPVFQALRMASKLLHIRKFVAVSAILFCLFFNANRAVAQEIVA